MGDSINVGFHVIGGEKKVNQLPKIKDPDRRYIADRISGTNLPEEIKEELLRRLRDYPDGALLTFYSKLPDLIETLKIQRAKNEL
jgi:hypothetical protein